MIYLTDWKTRSDNIVPSHEKPSILECYAKCKKADNYLAKVLSGNEKQQPRKKSRFFQLFYHRNYLFDPMLYVQVGETGCSTNTMCTVNQSNINIVLLHCWPAIEEGDAFIVLYSLKCRISN